MTTNVPSSVEDITIPDSKLGRAITEFVRDTESELLFNHSSRVYLFGALAGRQRGLTFNPELLYAAAMFHDVGLMPSHSSADLRFEVDGANAARDFLLGHGVDPSDVERAWTGIALHTTPGREILSSGRYAEEVRAAEHLWQSRGISAVPAVVINGKYLISGGQPPEAFEKALLGIAEEAAHA